MGIAHLLQELVGNAHPTLDSGVAEASACANLYQLYPLLPLLSQRFWQARVFKPYSSAESSYHPWYKFLLVPII